MADFSTPVEDVGGDKTVFVSNFDDAIRKAVVQGALVMTNTGTGSNNDLVATVNKTINDGATVILKIPGNNSGNMTATLNGETYSLRMINGDHVDPNGVRAGMIILALVNKASGILQMFLWQDASASEAMAKLWASEDEDVEVKDGKFSALHYAEKSDERADVAELNAAQAEGYRDGALAAAEVSGLVKFYDTKALADADLVNLSDEQVVEIFADESRAGVRTRYRVEGGAFAYKLAFMESGVQFNTVADLLDDTLFDYASGLVVPGDVVTTREGGFAYNVMLPTATDHDPVTNPDGAWPLPAVIKVRGEQVPEGGFDLRQFGKPGAGGDWYEPLQIGLQVCSGAATYNGVGDNYRGADVAPLRLPAGKIGFDGELTHRTGALLVGCGMQQTYLYRLSRDAGAAIKSVHFDDLQADPTSQPLPGGMGLIDLTIVEGNDGDTAYGDGRPAVALNGFGLICKNVQIFAPWRNGGLYTNQDRAAAGLSTKLYPQQRVEDIFDNVVVTRCGGDGIDLGNNDAHYGRIWSYTNRGVGMRNRAKSTQALYIHCYANHRWNYLQTGAGFDCEKLEARDGLEGGIAMLATNYHIGHLIANNNMRRLGLNADWSDEPTEGFEEYGDLVVAGRDGSINFDITTSQKKRAVRIDGSLLGNSTVSGVKLTGRIKAPEYPSTPVDPEDPGYPAYLAALDVAGKGNGIEIVSSGVGNTIDVHFSNFDHVDAKGVHVTGTGGQTNLDLRVNMGVEQDPVDFTMVHLDGGVPDSEITIRGSSDKVTLLAGSGNIASTKFNVFDYAADPVNGLVTVHTPNIDITSAGVKTATIALPGGWIGATPSALNGQAQVSVIQGTQVYDYVLSTPVVKINDNDIEVYIKVEDPSALPGAYVRVAVTAWVGRR